jgi:hypothetical protein
MRGLREAAETAVANPDAIYQSRSDPDCRLYYRAGARAGLMICVVADAAAGFVKTAYLSKRIKPGAKEWPSPNPSKAPPGPSGSTTT